jgi:hypothetical protein
MAAEVARNGWGIVNHHQQQGILELRWLPSTAEMTDATDFHHRFGEGVMAWRDQQIIPRYNASGTRRFAFHVPDGFPDAIEAGGQPIIDGPATFPTAWFTQRQHALDWLGNE